MGMVDGMEVIDILSFWHHPFHLWHEKHGDLATWMESITTKDNQMPCHMLISELFHLWFQKNEKSQRNTDSNVSFNFNQSPSIFGFTREKMNILEYRGSPNGRSRLNLANHRSLLFSFISWQNRTHYLFWTKVYVAETDLHIPVNATYC